MSSLFVVTTSELLRGEDGNDLNLHLLSHYLWIKRDKEWLGVMDWS